VTANSPSVRLAGLRTRIEETSRLVAAGDGYPARAGRIDVQVAEWFADYVEWELAHPEITQDALMGDRFFHPVDTDEAGPCFRPEGIDWERERGRKPAGSEEATRRYHHHIERQLDGASALLDQAVTRLREDRHWPEPCEPDWSRMTFSDGFFRTGGRPAFPAGFNMLLQGLVDLSEHPEYAEESEKRLDAFHKEMRALGVGMVSHGISIPAFYSPAGGIRQDLLRGHVTQIERLTAKGFKVSVLLHWGGDAAALEKRWPGITRRGGNGVGLDVDHPGSRELVREVGAGVFPVLGKLPGVIAWDLANEPFFDMDKWSPHGLRNYQGWLEERHGSIERLNQRWRTELEGFAEVRSPKDRPRGHCSPGEWHDQVTFHNHRVTSFFGFVSGEIHRHVPGTLVHMKSQDNSSLGPMPAAVAHGIDREGLTPFCQLQGLDTRPLPVTEPRMAASDYDGGPYALHWLGQSFTFDYLTSLPPRCPVIDLEYHAFSINAIRMPDLTADHGRVALWLAHLHGMVGNMAWYWHRRWGPNPFPAEYFQWWFRDSLSTQPLAAAGYFHTMLELNAVAPEVERLATAPDRPLRLLVSMPSYIHDQSHIDALHRVYEGVCFHGLPVGFVTGDMLARDGVPDDCRMLIIPNVGRLSTEALAALETADRAGVRLMRYGKLRPVLDPYGLPHPDKAIAFLKMVPEIAEGAAEELSRRMIETLAPMGKQRPLQVSRTDTPGAFGVMHRAVETGDGTLVLLVNVLNRPITVRLIDKEDSPPRGDDLINGQAVDGAKIQLPVRGVRLVRVD
jgi:beta-galactosidase